MRPCRSEQGGRLLYACGDTGRVQDGIFGTQEKKSYEKSPFFCFLDEAEPVIRPAEYCFKGKRCALRDERVPLILRLLSGSDLTGTFRKPA
jgi:hypothetical protein